MMALKDGKQDAPQVATQFVNPYDHYDREIPFRNNEPIAVCRVVKGGGYLRGNVPGDRVGLDPKQAVWLAKQGQVIVEIAKVAPSDIRAAGSIDAYLAANPKADKLSKQARAKLRPIPGIPSGNERQPWDFEDVD